MSSANTNVQSKIQVANVLRHELETLKPGRKVYVQQPGSLVFFKDSRDTALQNCQETLKSLRNDLEHGQHKMDQGD